MRLPSADPVQLTQDTLLAYANYLRNVEAEPARGPAPRLSDSEAVAERKSGKRPIQVPEGLIHDWIGATRAAGVTMPQVLAVLQDYDNHKKIYARDVIDSKLRTRHDDDFQIHLRIRKKKIVTVVLDTEHDVHYSCLDPARWLCRSRTTRIVEVEEAGKPSEWMRLPGTGYGFLWSLASYWRLEEKNGGVDIECRAVSLTRDIPKALAWVIEPMVDKLPGEALRYTLEATRRALAPAAAPPPLISGAV